jgi:hypothetical protein
MKRMALACAALAAAIAAALGASCTSGPPIAFSGADCQRPPALLCADKDCPREITTHQGSVLEPASGRTYFLDYPCDLKAGEKVTLVLSLHGGGSYGNWHRNYFPMAEYADKHRLVIATPNSRGWSANDDAYMQSIVEAAIKTIGAKNIQSFWLAGHSAGSAYTRRMACSPFYRDKVDGVLTLGGGRIGSASSAGGPPGPITPQAGAAPRPPGPPPGAGAPPGPRPAAAEPVFDCDFSFIFVVGEHEAIAQTLPQDSSWAARYGCKPREMSAEIADAKGGRVWDPSRQPGNDAWGHEPRGGTAKIMRFPGCRDGRVVADVVRLAKGHTEGVEPKITEELVKLMVSAKGGKLAKAS